jgi:glutamate/tyrosine decarboxylase-like PLP-dependent enzyme
MDQELFLPEKGRRWEQLQDEMKAMAKGDLDWRRGRHASYVWYADDNVEHVAREAYGMFMSENGLNTQAFPSLHRMENEVVAMVLSLLKGDAETTGHMTSGGTESIFLAVKAARDWARKHRPGIQQPEVVAPVSAHPALNKAAHYLGLRVKRVPTGPDFRADVDELSRACGPETIMMYASAPAYSVGVIDPVESIGEAALEHKLWLHVDACVGGILAPFVRELGYPVPLFDFSLPGVTSISADLHKSGYTGKGASTVLFRDKGLQEYARFTFDEWPTGGYTSLTFTGTRPGGAIASAWAVMKYLGREGYLKIADTVMETRKRFVGGLTRIDGIHILGEPDLWAVAYGSSKDDINLIANQMAREGWRISPVKDPPGIHMMITPVHVPYIDEYLGTLRRAVDFSRTGDKTDVRIEDTRYS